VSLLLAGAALSCSGAGGGANDAPGGAGSGGVVAATGGGGGTGPGGGSGGELGCPKGPGFAPTGAPQLINHVTARLLDESGAPAAQVPVLVCGFGACSKPGTTSAQGELCTLDKATGLCSPGMQPGLEITRPALKYGLGIEHVKFAQLLPPGSEHAVGDVTAFRLPEVAQGAALVPGSTATSNGVSVTLAPDTTLEHDLLVFDEPALLGFRATLIPIAKAPGAVDPSLGFGILVGTTPVDTKLCPPAALSVPNTAGWAAGTEVEIWVHGVSILEDWAPYGGWGKLSNGRVSDDGTRVTSTGGVPILGLFGIRKL